MKIEIKIECLFNKYKFCGFCVFFLNYFKNMVYLFCKSEFDSKILNFFYNNNLNMRNKNVMNCCKWNIYVIMFYFIFLF